MKQITIDALKKCPLFAGLTEQNLKVLLNEISFRQIRLAKKSLYCLKGDHCTNVDIVIDGEMVARMTGTSGKQMEVTRIRKGEVVAPCFIYSTDKSLPVEIEAATETQILRIHPDTLASLADTNTTIRRNLTRTISDIGTYLASKISFLSLLTVKEKVTHYLCSEVYAQRSRHLSLSISRQHLADSFAIQKFSLLRCMADLAKKGIIEISGKEITILDFDRLR